MANKKAERKKRTPLGVPRQKLAVTGRQGYKRRWINDRDGRIQQALEGDYQFVSQSRSSGARSDI